MIASSELEAQTRTAVEKYFEGWTHRKVDDAYAQLAEDLEFIGPGAHYRSAAEFKPALAGFSALTKWARIDQFMVQGDRAFMLYDCELVNGAKLRIASYFQVKSGKIRVYETQFDPTEFQKLVASVRQSKE